MSEMNGAQNEQVQWVMGLHTPVAENPEPNFQRRGKMSGDVA